MEQKASVFSDKQSNKDHFEQSHSIQIPTKKTVKLSQNEETGVFQEKIQKVSDLNQLHEETAYTRKEDENSKPNYEVPSTPPPTPADTTDESDIDSEFLHRVRNATSQKPKGVSIGNPD